MRVYCIRTKVYTFVYSGGRGTFEHSFSISRFFRFLSLTHTLYLSLSLSLHQTTRCTRISRISLIVYLRIVRYARRRTKYLMPDFFFLFLVPAYGGSTFYYRVNICLALSPNYKRDKQSRVFADQSSKVKRKKRETPKKKKRTRNRESNRSGVEMHSLNAMLNKKKEKKKKMTGTTAHAVYYFLRDTHVSHRVMGGCFLCDV